MKNWSDKKQQITYFLTLTGLALFAGNVFGFNAEGFLSMLDTFFAVFWLLESVFLGSIFLDIVGGGLGVQISGQEGHYDQMP